MKEKLKQYLETEKIYVRAGLLHKDDTEQKNKICWYAIQRALGAVDMAQLCGLDSVTAEKMFFNYCDELKGMKHDNKC